MAANSDLLLSTKTCSKCKRKLPLEQFHKNRSMMDGYAHECKQCKHAYNVAYHRNHRERHNKRTSDYYVVHREQVKERMAARCRTVDGYITQLWHDLNRRTVNGSHPRWDDPSCRRYLRLGVRLEMIRNELEVLVVQHWPENQAIWDSGESVHIHRIGPSIHYSADNIEFLSQSDHQACHSRTRYEDVGQT